jgi:hypothetical protein
MVTNRDPKIKNNTNYIRKDENNNINAVVC